MIFKVFLYLDDTIDNNDDNGPEVQKDNEVCRDLFRLWLVFFIFLDASYNLRKVIFNRTAFRQRCCPNLIQSIIPLPGVYLLSLRLWQYWPIFLEPLCRIRDESDPLGC